MSEGLSFLEKTPDPVLDEERVGENLAHRLYLARQRIRQSIDGAERHRQEELMKNFLWGMQQPGYDTALRIATGESPESVYGKEILTRVFCLEGPQGPVQIAFICFDGRVLLMDSKNRWMIKYGMAANGRLLTPEEFDQVIAKWEEVCDTKLERDPSDLIATYHADCGACTMYCNQVNPGRIAQGLQPMNPIEAGQEVALELKQRLKLKNEPVFIPSNHLAGAEFGGNRWHPERAVCIDLTGCARPRLLSTNGDDTFPHSFQMGALIYPNPQKLADELTIMLDKIALDYHHGMGNRFNCLQGKENRMLVTVFQDPLDSALTAEMMQAIEPVVRQREDQVLLVPFPVPPEYVRNRMRRRP